jgi:16S rRNA (adenine1518-N6/adenine1519-N6)-dimethyltransferase
MHANLKKKFGQNFLIDKNIQNKICKLIPANFLNVLEIGPGDGCLTEQVLLSKPEELKVIEIDPDLIPILKFRFSKNQNVKILNQDILNYPLNEKIDIIISNLPYNISSQILVKICLMEILPTYLILMFQKEFAERLITKKLNSLNSLVNCFYEINSSFNVSKNCFRPIPKIDSTVLFFKRKKNILLKKIEINEFIEFKRKLFSHKRKILNYCLKNYNFNKEKFDLNLRIQDIDLQQLIKLFREINL